MWRTITRKTSTHLKLIKQKKQKLIRSCIHSSPSSFSSDFSIFGTDSSATRISCYGGTSLPSSNSQESFSAADSVVCTLTSHCSKQPIVHSRTNQCTKRSSVSVRFILFSVPSSLFSFNGVCFQGNLCFRKAFGSSAQVISKLTETVAEESTQMEPNPSLDSEKVPKDGHLTENSQICSNVAKQIAENSFDPMKMPQNILDSMEKTDSLKETMVERISAEGHTLISDAPERLSGETNDHLSLCEAIQIVKNGKKSKSKVTNDLALPVVLNEGKRKSIGTNAISSCEPQLRVNSQDKPRVSKIMWKEENDVATSLKLYNQKMRRKQRKMEMEAYWRATLEYKDMVVRMCKKKLAPNVPFVRGLLLSWFEPYRDALLEEQKAILDKEHLPDRNVYGPFLLQLPADILAVVVMHKLMSVLMREQEQGYVRLLTVASAIGEAVEQEAEIFRLMTKRKKKRRGDTTPSTKEEILQLNLDKMIKQQNVQLLDKILKKERVSKPWGSPVQVKVGSRLVDILMNVAFIHPPASQSPTHDPPEVRPALKHEHKVIHSTKKRPSRNIGVLTCDPLVWSTLEKSARFVEMPYMPMLVEPVKWTSYKKGGYMVLRSRLMRTHGTRSQQIALTRTPKTQLKRVFEALDVLGRTPWRINVQVLNVIEKIWSDGGCLGGLVDRNDLEMPKKPDTTDEQEIRNWRRELFKRKRINSERHSQCCDIELKLSVARKYKNESKFYFPHNLDFRGRAYPMHPYLNHLGSDLCRGLLEFGVGRPLGSTGLRWLKIHLANVFAGGVDKLSFSERVAFVDQNIDNIKNSAERPLEGNRWWSGAEDPFQCLAACMSLRDALESGDVEKYICFTPVQQDGSCNGLQHYAALGRDIVGAESVNLVAGDRPADVYSVIADRVRQIVERDANNDLSTSSVADCARALVGHVDRKLVKQTVMTSVYGVTFVGARAQILNRLEEKGKESDDNQLFPASSYAAKTTLEALGEMFKEAKSIMNWLAECAKLVASENEAVKWSSPLGLPVVQPYRKPGWKQVKTSLQTFTLRNDNDQPVFVQRQKSAFPPNFVHSLDSTHMMMTAVACGEAGLLFAGVHDSFWTHAADVDKMNQILRERFVELYKQPILENLLKSFQKSFPGIECPPIPQRGDFVLDEILSSPYFFN